MKAIILAGGEGKRLRPLTATRPKPLMRVGDRAILDILLERLSEHRVREAAVTLGYRGDDIVREIGDEAYGVRISYFREDKPLGTAGCVKNCGDFIDGDTLILSADALTELDFTSLLEYHRSKDAAVTLAVTRRDTPRLYGTVEMRGDGRVMEFKEKPPLPDGVEATVNCGIYIIKKEVLGLIPSDKPYDFAGELFPLMLKEGLPIFAYPTDAFWCDIGSFSEYRRSNLLTLGDDFFVKGSESPVASRGVITHSIVGRGSRILTDAVINDSVVGRNTRIGSGTHLDSCILGDGVTVGEGVNISAGAVVGDFAIVGDGVTVTDGMHLEAYSVFMG